MTKPITLHHTGMTKPAAVISQPASSRSRWRMAIRVKRTTAVAVNGFTACLFPSV